MGRRRCYLDQGRAMGRLIRFIVQHQAEHLVAPSRSAMARAVGTSRSQISRLLEIALRGGILKESSETPLRYEVILNPPHLPGIVRVPVTECRWSRQMRWNDTGSRGVWLDQMAYQLGADPTGYWAVIFPELPRDGKMPPLRLNEHALALVRRCETYELQEGHWYLVEHESRIIVASLFNKTKGVMRFRAGAGDSAPRAIAPSEITAIAEVMMTTTRPPLPVLLPGV